MQEKSEPTLVITQRFARWKATKVTTAAERMVWEEMAAALCDHDWGEEERKELTPEDFEDFEAAATDGATCPKCGVKLHLVELGMVCPEAFQQSCYNCKHSIYEAEDKWTCAMAPGKVSSRRYQEFVAQNAKSPTCPLWEGLTTKEAPWLEDTNEF